VPSDAGECIRVAEISRCGVAGGERSENKGSCWRGGVAVRSIGVLLAVLAAMGGGVVVRVGVLLLFGVADTGRNL
jgi:hypothetical protein